MTRGVVSYPNGQLEAVELGEIEAEHAKNMQDIVGGYVELVTFTGEPPVTMWCNEDGWGLQLPANLLASHIAHTTVMGPVIFAGPPDAEGHLTSIHDDWWVELIRLANDIW
jgi:Domain of unknown function (DUF3846)